MTQWAKWKEKLNDRLQAAIPLVVRDHLIEMEAMKEFAVYLRHAPDYPEKTARTMRTFSESLFQDDVTFPAFVAASDKEAYKIGIAYAKSDFFTVELMMQLSHSTRMCGLRHFLPIIGSSQASRILIERYFEWTNQRQNSFFRGYVSEQNKKLKWQSETDPLTSLYNRRMFYQSIERDVNESRLHRTPLTLVLIDLNDFKKVNDEYGHILGDELLQYLAKQLSNIRKEGAFRIGGDEFLLLLPYDEEEAMQRVGKLNENLLAHHTALSISYGTVQLPTLEQTDSIDIDHFIKMADDRMYVHKEQSRIS